MWGVQKRGGTASGFAPAPFMSLLCAREDRCTHPHSQVGPQSAICMQMGARGSAPLLCLRMVPPSLPRLHTTLALHFATLTIRLASHFCIKGVCTPFPFTHAPSPVSATPVPMHLHMADREPMEKKGGRGTQVNQGVVQARGGGGGSPTGWGHAQGRDAWQWGRMLFVHHLTLCPQFACPSACKGGGA